MLPEQHHKLITITGGDLCGKATQCEILKQLITKQYGFCAKFSFPRYDRPFGKLMGAMLDEIPFEIRRPIHNIYDERGLRCGDWAGVVSKDGKGEVYQFLCAADKYDAQQEIGAALACGHVVCDRYDPELLVYGVTDFEGKEQLSRAMMEGLTHRSDIVIVLWNSKGCFSRAGEIPDYNERNRKFQETAFNNFKRFAPEYGWHIIDIADLICDNIITSVCQVNNEIIKMVNTSGLPLSGPADRDLVKSVLIDKGALPNSETALEQSA